jgi:hypothetical protein
LDDGKIRLVGQSSPYIQVGNSDDYSIKIATDGTDQYIAMGGKMSSGSGFAAEGAVTGGILIGMDNGNPQAEFVSDDLQTYFIFDGDSGLDVKTTAFELAANDDDLQISSTQKSMSLASGKILLDGGGNFGYIRVGGSTSAAGAVHISGSGTTGIIKAGKTSYSDTQAGFVLEKTATDSRFYVGDSSDGSFIKFDTSNALQIKSQKVEIAANTDDLQISSTNASMSLAGGKILLDGGGNYGYARIGSSGTYDNNINISGSATQAIIKAGKTSYSDTVNAGFVLEKTATDSKFYVGDASDGSFIKFDSDTGIDIASQKFELAAGTSDLQISSTKASMSLAGGTILLDGGETSGYIRVGSNATTRDNIQISGSATLAVIKAGITGSYADAVSAGDNGFILERNLTSTKFHIGNATEYIRFDGSNVDIAAANFNLTASAVNITAADGMEVDAPDFEISTLHKSMSLGYTTNTAYGVTMVGASDSYISFGPKTSPNFQLYSAGETTNYLQIGGKSFGDTTAGIILGENSGVEQSKIRICIFINFRLFNT